MANPSATEPVGWLLRTFGAPVLLDAGGRPVTSLRRKDLALLIHLVVERGRHSRSVLAGLLWGNDSEDRARHSLTQALRRIRKVLGPGSVDPGHATVEWIGGLTCDAAAFDALAVDGGAGTVLELYRGDFLADFSAGRGAAEFELWADGKRAEYRLKAVALLDEAGREAEDRGEWGSAVRLGLRVVEIEPIFEEGHRRVMRAWSALGERPLALQHYERFVEHLRAEYELEPDGATRSLADSIRGGATIAGQIGGAAGRPSGPDPSAAASATEAADSRSLRPGTGGRRAEPGGQHGDPGLRPADPSARRPESLRRPPNAGQPPAGSGSGPHDPAVSTAPVRRPLRRRLAAAALLLGIPALLLLSVTLLGDAGGGPLPADGEHVRLRGSPAVYLVFGGNRWEYPDWDTFLACTGGHGSVIRTVRSMPPLAPAAALPSVLRHEWLGTMRPVKSPGDSTVFVVIGCVRAAAPAGHDLGEEPVTVPRAILESVPRGPGLVLPIRPAGTLIKSRDGPEVRWIVFSGGALSVPSEAVLRSHCRSLVIELDPAEFDRYASVGALQPATVTCNRS